MIRDICRRWRRFVTRKQSRVALDEGVMTMFEEELKKAMRE